MTLAKISSIKRRRNRYSLSSDAHSLWPYGKLRVKSTCVAQRQSDICRFRTQRFSISKLAAKNKNFYRGLLIKSVRTSNGISVPSFARAKSILCACPAIGSVRGLKILVPWRLEVEGLIIMIMRDGITNLGLITPTSASGHGPWMDHIVCTPTQ